MIDVTQQVNAVRRRVGARLFREGEARVVIVSRTYDAPPADVWDACTNPERLPRWFLPVTGELRLGGRYQLEGNAGGTIEECDPPRSFIATWEYGGSTGWIQLRLSPADEPAGGTRFELDHIAPDDDEHWTRFGPGAVGIGWDMALIGLTEHLATGRPVDAEAMAAWAASAEGRRFVTLTGDRWRAADVEGGEDEAVARAAADRTIAAYTGAE